MDKYKFVMPEILEVGDEPEDKVDNPFSGEVILKIPAYPERIKFIRALKYDVNEKGEQSLVDGITQLERFYTVKPHIESMDVVIKDSGEKISDLDKLLSYEEGAFILKLLVKIVADGIKLGKPSKKISSVPQKLPSEAKAEPQESTT